MDNIKKTNIIGILFSNVVVYFTAEYIVIPVFKSAKLAINPIVDLIIRLSAQADSSLIEILIFMVVVALLFENQDKKLSITDSLVSACIQKGYFAKKEKYLKSLSGEERDKEIKKLSKVLQSIRIFVLTMFIILSVLTFAFLFLPMAMESDFNYQMRIVRPYISDDEFYLFNSNWALMDGYEDYIRINDRIKVITSQIRG